MSKTKTTELLEAIKVGDLVTVTSLLDADRSLVSACNEQGLSPILVAVRAGRAEVRDLLLARGIELDLFEALAVGQFDRVKELVESNPALKSSFRRNLGRVDVAEFLRQLSRSRQQRTSGILRRAGQWLH